MEKQVKNKIILKFYQKNGTEGDSGPKSLSKYCPCFQCVFSYKNILHVSLQSDLILITMVSHLYCIDWSFLQDFILLKVSSVEKCSEALSHIDFWP